MLCKISRSVFAAALSTYTPFDFSPEKAKTGQILEIGQQGCSALAVTAIPFPAQNWELLTIHGKASKAQRQSLWKMTACNKIDWHFLRAGSHAS